jgi:hypothetical protein
MASMTGSVDTNTFPTPWRTTAAADAGDTVEPACMKV